jgi:hypothetical protein
VEIRAEDMDSSVQYLDTNYPFEMFDMITRYPEKEIVGFDWLGEELEGRAIPENYWRDVNIIKKTERALQKDTKILSRLSKADSLHQLKVEIFTQASLQELNNGRYDSINTQYYDILEKKFAGTPYQILTDFYRARNEHISQNIAETVRKHPGKKLLFLTGADHRSYVVNYLKQNMKSSINLH